MFVLWIIFEVVYYIMHRNSLSHERIEKLSKKRRKKYIHKVFQFEANSINYSPTNEFKSSIKPNGKMYVCDIPVKDFPFFAAQLLKGKKHEWVIIAFEKNLTIKQFWVNKGPNNEHVSYKIDITDIVNICKVNNYTSVIRLHNHPNSDPKHYDCLVASDQDYYSAKCNSNILIDKGINWLDFVCERGNWLLFYKAISIDYFPMDSDYEVIANQNGNSVFGNYLLNREADGLLQWNYLVLSLIFVFLAIITVLCA